MHMVCVIPAMQSGGAERVLGRLANHWAGLGWSVTVLTYESEGAKSFYPLDPLVVFKPLGLAGKSHGILQAAVRIVTRLAALRRNLAEAAPAVVLSFCAEMNVEVLLATIGQNIPVVVSERVDPNMHRIGRFWAAMRRILYRRADRVVVQAAGAGSFFTGWGGVRMQVIPNSVPAMGLSSRQGDRLLAVGRLVPQKGFDLLLQAFALIARKYPGRQLRIVGEGPERPRLERLIWELDLAGRVEMPGVVSEIEQEYQTASVFVLSSRYEGFPNGLCEAMAAGLPVVAFACPGAITEIVRHKVDGLLASPGDIPDLAACIDQLLDDEHLQERLAARGREIIGRFSECRITKEWTACLLAVSGKGCTS